LYSFVIFVTKIVPKTNLILENKIMKNTNSVSGLFSAELKIENQNVKIDDKNVKIGRGGGGRKD
jgi:hypothetical protein